MSVRLLVILGFLEFSANVCRAQTEDTLVLAHVIFRHGERTPDNDITFPTNMYAGETFYPYGQGQLTQRGINSCYRFGKFLRRRYDNFLGKIFEPKILEALSSEYRRTRMSMQSVLAGLFPPAKPYIIDERIHWQPIPFNYLPVEDKLIATHRGYKQLMHVPKNFSAASPETREFYEYVSKHSGWNVTTVGVMSYITDTVSTQVNLGLSQPEWVKKIWPEPLKSAIMEFWHSICYNETRRHYAGGNLMNKIVDDTVRKIDGRNEEKKIALYSGHDITVVGAMANLKVFDNKTVNYVSSLIVEIHKIQSSYFAKILYRNYEEEEPVELSMPGCKILCPIRKFIKLAAVTMPKDS